MTDLARITNLRVKRGPFATQSWPVANAVVVDVDDVLIGLASTGFAGPLSTATYNKFLGTLEPSGRNPLPVTGDSAGLPPPEVVVTDEPTMLLGAPVTGVVAVTDHLAPVYATDTKTLTLSSAGGAVLVGYVYRFVAAGYADVRLYSAAELRLKAA